MQKLQFKIRIDAPREIVWEAMLGDATYRDWTSEFSEGSYYSGEWKSGARMLFLGPDPQTGSLSGMISRIKEARACEFVSIEHLGNVNAGVEDTASDAAQSWKGALENYTFKPAGEGTELIVDTDSADSHRQMFEEAWPKALTRLKGIAERMARK